MDDFQQPVSDKKVMVDVAHGIAGMIKAMRGDAVLAEKRLEICKTCDLMELNKKGEPGFCGHPWYKLLRRDPIVDGCGCWLKMKAKDKDERCPREKWADVKGD